MAGLPPWQSTQERPWSCWCMEWESVAEWQTEQEAEPARTSSCARLRAGAAGYVKPRAARSSELVASARTGVVVGAGLWEEVLSWQQDKSRKAASVIGRRRWYGRMGSS